MECKTIKLLFENELNLEIVSKIINNDKAFLCSLLKIAGCKDIPDMAEFRFGITSIKEKE